MDLGELDEFLNGEFRFAVAGKQYCVTAVPWPTYLELLQMQSHAEKVAAGTAQQGDGPADEPLYQLAPRLLGPVLDEMIADGVPGPKIMHTVRAAYFWQLGEQEIARVMWADVGKAPAPAVGSGSTSTTRTGSTPTVSGTATKRRASTRGTRSPRTSQPPSPSTTAPMSSV